MNLFQAEAEGFLKLAKQSLIKDKYLAPVVLVLYETEMEAYLMKFGSADEKERLYNSLWEHLRVKPVPPNCIFMIFDAYMKIVETKDDLENYKSGSLQEAAQRGEAMQEIISMVISPRLGSDWGLTLPYTRKGDEFVFDEIIRNSNEGGDSLRGSLMPNWKKTV